MKTEKWFLPPEPRENGVMRKWTRSLSMRMQAVLVAAVRGCDGAPKNDPSKRILWAMRFDILNPSYAGGDLNPYKFSSFMGYCEDEECQAASLLGSLDQYPFHFVMHLAHAAEILGYFHPDFDRRRAWMMFYRTLCRENLHCRHETRASLERRLRDR